MKQINLFGLDLKKVVIGFLIISIILFLIYHFTTTNLLESKLNQQKGQNSLLEKQIKELDAHIYFYKKNALEAEKKADSLYMVFLEFEEERKKNNKNKNDAKNNIKYLTDKQLREYFSNRYK